MWPFVVKTITAENWGFLVISFFYSLTRSTPVTSSICIYTSLSIIPQSLPSMSLCAFIHRDLPLPSLNSFPRTSASSPSSWASPASYPLSQNQCYLGGRDCTAPDVCSYYSLICLLPKAGQLTFVIIINSQSLPSPVPWDPIASAPSSLGNDFINGQKQHPNPSQCVLSRPATPCLVHFLYCTL